MRKTGIIPHGNVPTSDIGDRIVADRIMKLGENDMSLARKVSALEEEIRILKAKAR